jgi:AAA15 family ATPase/GTPase
MFPCYTLRASENVNLIGGKNNVGKTAFLEVVELLVSSNEPYEFVANIYNLLTRRQNQDSSDFILDFIKENESQIKISTDHKICEISLKRQTNELDFDPEFFDLI